MIICDAPEGEGVDQSDQAAQPKNVARLWSKSQPAVAALVAGAVADFHDAEDVVAEVAEVVVAKFSDFDPARPFMPWAMGIAHKQILLYYRRRAGEKFLPFDEAAMEAVVSAHVDVADEVSARLAALRICVRQVRGKARRVLDLHYGHGLKTDAVADALNMTRNSVWVTMHRVRVALKACVERKLAEMGGNR